MMKGGDIAGLLIRQARLRLNWSQEGLCRGICAPSYLSKIEQGKAAPSPEVTELLLRRLGLVWTPEPESLEPCWKALLSGSPDFSSCYERLVQPRQESLACSPLAADALLLDAFYEDNMRSLPEEWESFLSNRQLALQRGLQGRWEEAVRLEPLPLLVTLRGKALYVKGDYTVAIEVLRDACRSAADAGYPHLMLSCRLWMGNCYSDLGRMEEMLAHFAVAERLAEALGDPFFCKYLCPQGVLEGAIPLSLANSGIRAALGKLFTWKFSILLSVIALSVLFYRPFCKWLCPLGAFYALFNRVSLFQMKVDKNKCVSCGKCARACKMDVDVTKTPNHTECIRCGMCIRACPTKAVCFRYGFGDGKEATTKINTEESK